MRPHSTTFEQSRAPSYLSLSLMHRGPSRGLRPSFRSAPSIGKLPYATRTIITAEHTRWPSDYPIHDLRPTGFDWVVRWKLFMLDNRALQRRIGCLGKRDRHGCRAALVDILDRGRVN
jgi:hypothetical protein